MGFASFALQKKTPGRVVQGGDIPGLVGKLYLLGEGSGGSGGKIHKNLQFSMHTPVNSFTFLSVNLSVLMP
jgi:hypothetical protein